MGDFCQMVEFGFDLLSSLKLYIGEAKITGENIWDM